MLGLRAVGLGKLRMLGAVHHLISGHLIPGGELIRGDWMLCRRMGHRDLLPENLKRASYFR